MLCLQHMPGPGAPGSPGQSLMRMFFPPLNSHAGRMELLGRDGVSYREHGCYLLMLTAAWQPHI